MVRIALRCQNLTRATLSHARSNGRAMCWVVLRELGTMGQRSKFWRSQSSQRLRSFAAHFQARTVIYSGAKQMR